MRTLTLLRRNLTHYGRTNLAVVAGVTITVAVLAGALLVGDSVRLSLRDLFLLRLGETSYVISAGNFFPESLAERLQTAGRFRQTYTAAVPLIALEGIVTHERSGRRGAGIQVYGVDERFWRFQGLEPEKYIGAGNGLLMSESLAAEFDPNPGDSILVRVQRQSDVPVDSLHGRKENLGRTMRFSLGGVLTAREMGEFSLRPQQGAVRAVFLPLEQLRGDLGQEGRVNTILVSEDGPQTGQRAARLEEALRAAASLEDLGLTLRVLEQQQTIILESERILLEDPVAEAARRAAGNAGMETTAVFGYLAATIRSGEREIPYSLVTAIDPTPSPNPEAAASEEGPVPIWLSRWAADDLKARPGDTVDLEYFLWEDGGQLLTEVARFELRGILPMRGLATDRDLAPTYPGITDSESVGDWDPPFPIDLRRVRPRDEAFWDRYHAAPKAFIPLDNGQDLWRSRYGQLTSLRLAPPEGSSPAEALASFQESLREALDPLQAGFVVYAARAEGTQASQGAVNFGEYFVYFSFFLVVSAVLLTGLFFKLGVEQRLREIGLLRALGFPPRKVGMLFLLEGLVLAVLGSLAGLVAAVYYGRLMMYGLRTWWVDAVGTTFLTLHVSSVSLTLGGLGGILAALLAIVWTLRGLRLVTPRSLLAGTATADTGGTDSRMVLQFGLGSLGFGLLLLLLGAAGGIPQVAGFFGSGTLLLVSMMCYLWVWLARKRQALLVRAGVNGLTRMGFRNATWRPGRSLLCIALMASATFIIVAVDSFRHDDAAASLDPASGTGGYPLLAESLLPLAYDPNTEEGREQMNLSDSDLRALESVHFTPFRLRPGEDASCLNLYQPRNPKILAAPREFTESGRFAFHSSLAETPEQEQNPWLLLGTEFPDGAIPVILDANSMTYVLHLGLGDDFVLTRHSGEPVRLRLVAALSDSIFQSELLISEENFLRTFPHEQGFRFFLVDSPRERADEVTEILEAGLSDSGFDVQATGERLAAFHRVENTYLSTFQTLGGLGLLLGTVGLAAVLLRNVLERRRELALLRAVGYRPADLAVLVLAENALLLALGLASGLVSALLAIAPALTERGGGLPAGSLGLLLGAVWLAGMAASLVAVLAVLRAPLVPVLRTE